jgi:hypothetical protein
MIPPRIRSSNPDIPVTVEEAVMKALEKKPKDRFQSAAEFSEALGRLDVNSCSGAETIDSRERDMSDYIEESRLGSWYERSKKRQYAHYQAAIYYNKWHYLVSVPQVVLSAFVGTSVFATLRQDVGLKVRIMIGCVSVLVAVFGALQAFLRFSERSEKHRSTSAKSASAAREIEVVIERSEQGNKTPMDTLDRIARHIDSIDADAPGIPIRIWKAGRNLREDIGTRRHD